MGKQLFEVLFKVVGWFEAVECILGDCCIEAGAVGGIVDDSNRTRAREARSPVNLSVESFLVNMTNCWVKGGSRGEEE